MKPLKTPRMTKMLVLSPNAQHVGNRSMIQTAVAMTIAIMLKVRAVIMYESRANSFRALPQT